MLPSLRPSSRSLDSRPNQFPVPNNPQTVTMFFGYRVTDFKSVTVSVFLVTWSYFLVLLMLLNILLWLARALWKSLSAQGQSPIPKNCRFWGKTNFYAVTIFFGNQVTNRKFVTVLLFLPPLGKFWLEPILLLPFSRPVRALRKTKICFDGISKNILQFFAWFEPPIQLVMVIPLWIFLYIEFCFGLPEKIHVEVTIGVTIERILWPNISFDLYSW